MTELSLLWILPFAAFLLCIAIVPLVNAGFWDKNLWWISLFVFCLPMAIACVFFLGAPIQRLAIEKALDYVSFIILLAALFIISGGIYIHGHFSGKPLTNTVFLLIGSVLASIIGTTGASMLLVRPLIRSNRDRKKKAHVIVFFIFLAGNIGGLLTPLGDPPLFLGYLQGVPFTWTLRLFPQWFMACGIVLGVFFMYDSYRYREETRRVHEKIIALENREKELLAVEGKANLALLAGVMLVVFLHGLMLKKFPGLWPAFGPQEIGMLILAAVSLRLTPTKSALRHRNRFSFHPIKEVALIFAAIFATMVPALYILEHTGAQLGLSKPWQFFWATGILSSFLDNAPTYLTFLSVAKGLHLAGDTGFLLSDGGTLTNALLSAISCGAVFMGANSYIGNGPNFMIRFIAEDQGVEMPGFFGYMLYSGIVLIPLFVLMTIIFFL